MIWRCRQTRGMSWCWTRKPGRDRDPETHAAKARAHGVFAFDHDSGGSAAECNCGEGVYGDRSGEEIDDPLPRSRKADSLRLRSGQAPVALWLPGITINVLNLRRLRAELIQRGFQVGGYRRRFAGFNVAARHHVDKL